MYFTFFWQSIQSWCFFIRYCFQIWPLFKQFCSGWNRMQWRWALCCGLSVGDFFFSMLWYWKLYPLHFACIGYLQCSNARIGALEVTVSFPFCVHFGDFLPAFKLVSASVWASVAKSGFLFLNLDFLWHFDCSLQLPGRACIEKQRGAGVSCQQWGGGRLSQLIMSQRQKDKCVLKKRVVPVSVRERRGIPEGEPWLLSFTFLIKMNDRAMMRETQANYRRRRQLVLRRPGPHQVPRLTCFWKLPIKSFQ